MKLKTGISILLMGTALVGCAGLNPEYVHKDGVRPGTVKRVGNDPEILEKISSTCANVAKAKSYAMIQYTGNSHLRWRSFPIPDGTVIQAGDKVNLNVNACSFTVQKA